MSRARRKPYDPGAKVHDRRTSDLVRNALVAPIEIDDPLEAGSRLMVMRSVRNDPLASLHARSFIDEAQYIAGRAFQRDFEAAERGPCAIDPSKEAVDGGMAPEPITEAQQRAARQLAVVYRLLGQNGSAIAVSVLIDGLSLDQVCAIRGLTGERERRYIGRRLRECLDEMARFYGFATKTACRDRSA